MLWQNQSHKIRPLKRMRHWYSTNVYFCVPTLREGIRLGTAHSFFAKLRWFLLLRRNSMIWAMVNLQALGLIFIFPGQIFIIVGCRHENPVIHYGASLSAATSPACSYIPIHIDQFCINIAPSPLSPDHPQTEWTSLQKLEAYGPSRQTNAKRGEINIWYTCGSGWLQVVLLFGTLPSYGSNKL